MTDELITSRLTTLLSTLKPKTKQPASTKILNAWMAQAESHLGEEAQGGRLGWLVASSVAIAAVQRAVDDFGRHLFLLRGGTLLQHRLNITARATKDVDGLIRGDFDEFFLRLETALTHPWGPLTLRRGEIALINVPTRVIKPRRFDIILDIRGVTWRRIQFEVSPDEAGISCEQEAMRPPQLSGFGLPEPDSLVGIAMRFQIAQKIHAVSDLHSPPEFFNDRVRDVIDLLLIRDLIAASGGPTLTEIHEASRALFTARETEAISLALPTRGWPPHITAHEHWGPEYIRLAAAARINSPLQNAINEVNNWIREIACA